MEFAEGETLDRLARRKALPIAKVLDVARQIVLGLQHLDEQGVIHRDIKPQNIILTPKGEVKIADFGIARDVGRDHRLTQEGTGLGSLVYAAPEQIAGKGEFRSDMYGLGCTLYELMFGASPFPRDKNIEWMLDAKYQKIPKLEETADNIPGDISIFVHRLMQPQPSKRFDNYEALLDRITDLQSTP
jgi:serine/threonine-protein kinase